MNEKMQVIIFLVYSILLAISGLIFYILKKKSKDIKRKRKLSLYGGIVIFILMLGVIVIVGLPTKIIPIFIAVAIGMLYIGNKYTFYCQACGNSVQKPFKKIEFCPKCGTKIEN